MPSDEQLVDSLRAWVRHAEHDLTNAVHTLKLGEECPAETVAFHVQQCIEKYLKALLLLDGIDFPKTHDLDYLFNLLPASRRPTSLTDESRSTIVEYAAAARYPGWGEVSLQQARHAVAVARKVRAEIRRQLPMRTKRGVR